MKYVYILQSTPDSEHYYTGITDNLKARLTKHNAFTDEKQAFEFEKHREEPLLRRGFGDGLQKIYYFLIR